MKRISFRKTRFKKVVLPWLGFDDKGRLVVAIEVPKKVENKSSKSVDNG